MRKLIVQSFITVDGVTQAPGALEEDTSGGFTYGGDIIAFGSPTLVQSLTNANLVDEYRILVHPVMVGEDGHKRLFENIVGRKDLKPLSTQTFKHGAVLMCYELVKS